MADVASTLRGSDRPLAESFDVALLDLDGVVYVGPDAVPGVPDALARAREHGMRLAFVTNNASRTPAAVARHLCELGVDAAADEVVTSAQAAAHYLADELGPGARVLVVGTDALAEALRERGLAPEHEAAPGGERVDAVVQGYSPETNWRMLAEAAVAINNGARWVATNADPTVPSPRGPLPGNGSLVAALRHATGAAPEITGKPDPTMHRETVQRTGAGNPIVVGDRLDTDIEGANAVGCASLLVLSGVTAPHELLGAPPRLRPTFLARDGSGLLDTHPGPERTGDAARCGGWTVRRVDGEDECWELAGDPDGGPDADLDALRALCAARWDASGTAGARADVRVRARGERAAAVLDRLGLARRAG